MNNHPKPGGITWRHYKIAAWMVSKGTFSSKEFRVDFKLSPSYASEILNLAVDAGLIVCLGRKDGKGYGYWYRVEAGKS